MEDSVDAPSPPPVFPGVDVCPLPSPVSPRPWLLEVNTSPALGVECAADREVKEPLVRDLWSMVRDLWSVICDLYMHPSTPAALR